MNLWPGNLNNQLKGINMNVGEYNGKSLGMVDGRYRKVCWLSRNSFWKYISCLVSDPTFGIGGSRLSKK